MQAKHGASDGGRLGPDFHTAHLNAAELETSAKIVEKAVQGQSLEICVCVCVCVCVYVPKVKLGDIYE